VGRNVRPLQSSGSAKQGLACCLHAGIDFRSHRVRNDVKFELMGDNTIAMGPFNALTIGKTGHRIKRYVRLSNRVKRVQACKSWHSAMFQCCAPFAGEH
jgi:hypothetical protein